MRTDSSSHISLCCLSIKVDTQHNTICIFSIQCISLFTANFCVHKLKDGCKYSNTHLEFEVLFTYAIFRRNHNQCLFVISRLFLDTYTLFLIETNCKQRPIHNAPDFQKCVYTTTFLTNNQTGTLTSLLSAGRSAESLRYVY